MSKVADKYFKVQPWKVVESGFNPTYGQVAESIFSLGNEYMGVRGYFEEGYSGPQLQGSYFNGVYESRGTNGQGYKGIVKTSEFMLNAVDFTYFRVTAGDEKLDLATSKFEQFVRELDLKTGLLKRSFVWNTKQGNLKITFEKLVSMVNYEQAGQKLSIESIDFNGKLQVEAGLNFDTVHGGEKKLWNCSGLTANNDMCAISGTTQTTKMEVTSKCKLSGNIVDLATAIPNIGEKKTTITYNVDVEKDSTYFIEKMVVNITPMSKKNVNAEVEVLQMNFEKMLQENTEWWNKIWEKSDIEITGDDENQQGIRFCIFQMYQTYHGAVQGTNIGAKGLTGEAYNGNAFWDTETYCLPFYLFHDKEAAKKLLYFRYATLNEARKRAVDLDCKGAFYPIATISGRECCDLWQHASLQLQASTAVAYGIWLYEKVTGDFSLALEYGLEILIEVCRMLATRGDFNSDLSHYGYYGVMGPDEFQMMVNHNCYTNYMGKFTFNYTLTVIDKMKEINNSRYEEIKASLLLDETEMIDWKKKADKMYIPYDEKSKIYEQHQGFFDLPHIEVDKIPVEEFPLYHNWSYDRIYRNDMIKQPDVLMLMLLFNSSFTMEELGKNYEYYEPRCIHESSLSPSVHSVLANQLGKKAEAYEFFKFATRMDLDNYNRNSNEGIHTTSIAAAWLNIVYGFGGLRSDGDVLSISPSIPDEWDNYKFRIVYKDEVITVKVFRDEVILNTIGGNEVEIMLYGRLTTIDGNEKRIAMANS